MGCNKFKRKTSLYLYQQMMNIQNYFKILEVAIEEIKKKLRDISVYIYFLQIDNLRSHCSIETLEFYYEIIYKLLIEYNILPTKIQ